MQYFRNRYRKSIRSVAAVLLLLFGVHILSIHGLVDNLVYCFEEDGQVNIESEAGSIFTIPSEDVIHAEESHNHEEPTLDAIQNGHHDLALSLICSKEQQVTRLDQERILKTLDGILKTSIEELSHSRVYQLVSFIPPLIENVISASLQTVVLIN